MALTKRIKTYSKTPRKRSLTHRLTQKAPRESDGLLSVETIYAGFNLMEDRIRRAIESGGTDSDISALIAKEWSSMFHHSLSDAAVKGLLMHYRKALPQTRAKTRKHRNKNKMNQHGGMAPIDYSMGQGTTAVTYGRFPDDFSTSSSAIKALDLNRFYDSSIGKSCDTISQKGGGIFDSLLAGHAPMSVPRNPIEMTVSAVQAAPITNPPAAPEVPTWTAATATPTPFQPSTVSNLAGLSPVFTGY